jgi:TonB-linked SusC/RagA family outer membrane protein
VNVDYTIIDRQVVLSARGIPINRSGFVQQQQAAVSGKVTDSGGEPLPGVSIVVKGTTRGTVTDADGEYTLTNIPSDATLVFSFVGMRTQEVVVGNQTTINVTMVEDIVSIEEVVAIGYGVQKKVTTTGAIGNVDMNIFTKRTNPNTFALMQGAIPGLTITRSGGNPGDENLDFKIRGESSLNGSVPLVIVDDVPYSDYHILNNLNPNDIESISVLKDASAAIYGARAAGGVVIVTTKIGTQEKPTFQYQARVTHKKAGIIVDATTRKEYALMLDEANKNDNLSAGNISVLYLRDWDYWMNGYDGAMPTPVAGIDLTYQDNRWSDIYFGPATDHSHNFNISGKSGKFKYFSSVGYFNENGIIQGGENYYNRLKSHIKGEYEINDKLIVELALMLETAIREEPTQIGRVTSGLGYYSYMGTPPNIAVENSYGQPYGSGGWRSSFVFLKDGGQREERFTNYNGKLKIHYNIINDLSLTGLIAKSGLNNISNSLAKSITFYTWENEIWANDPTQNASQVTKGTESNSYDNLHFYLNYIKQLNKSDFKLMTGTSYESNMINGYQAYRKNLISEEITSLNIGNAKEQFNSDYYSDWKIASVFGRANYSFMDKYLLEGNVRYDGSSRFIQGNRWGLFGGISCGWVVSEELFLKDNKFVDFLKLRGSWGNVGNQVGIGLYDYIQLINVNANTYPFGESGLRTGTTTIGEMVSKDRTWEHIKNTNLGLDFILSNQKLSASFDYYWKINENMLIPTTLPSVIGATPPTINIGSLHNWGWEAIIQWSDKVKEINYFVKATLSDNHNKLVDLAGSDDVNIGVVYAREGYPINSIFGYVAEGLIKNQDELDEYKKMDGVKQNLRIGDMKYKDISGNGKFSPYPDINDSGDLKYLGNKNIRYPFTFNAGINWKGFDFSFLIQGHLKQGCLMKQCATSSWWNNQDAYYIDKTWHPTRNPEGTYPAYSIMGDIVNWNYQSSTFSYYNNSYARLKNIIIGYTLPQRKIGGTNIRFFISGDDIFEIRSFGGGIDPEKNGNYDDLYPFLRYYTFGIDITL